MSSTSSYPTTPKTTFLSHFLHCHTLMQPSTTEQVVLIAEKRAWLRNLWYNTVITCLDCSRGNEASESAQGILDRMRASYAASNIGARPDTVIYGATMSSWSRIRREDATN